jgi:hypothetical protein
LPKAVVGLTDMPHLLATVRLIGAAHELALLDLDARGGDLELRGSYAVRDGHRIGAVIAKKSFVSVGLGVDDGGSHVRFFGLEGWLREQGCAANALMEIRSAACRALVAGKAKKASSKAKAR